MRIKICGITNLEQGNAIAQLGATDLGFICVTKSPRYVSPEKIAAIANHLPSQINPVGVFANADLATLVSTVQKTGLKTVQLHGQESPVFCQDFRSQLPKIEIIKAIAVKTPDSLTLTESYTQAVDTFLLDAYAPQQLGGTGKQFNWDYLQGFSPSRPWFLAGGLTPKNLQQVLTQANPDGIDLSSGVERSPGDKDLALVADLFHAIFRFPKQPAL